MSRAANDFQAAVFTALAAALAPVKVYDTPPQNAAYPYAVIGEDTSAPFDDAVRTGEEMTLVIHTWSRKQTKLEVKGLQKTVYNTLNRAALTVANNNLVDIQFEFGEVFEDDEADVVTFHGVQRFRALATHA